MRFLTQPKGILLIISLLVILLGFIAGSAVLDFHTHDTYFVFSEMSICIYIGLFFLLETAVYFITDDYRQWRFIQYFHVISVLIMLLSAIGWIFHITLTQGSYLDVNNTISNLLILFFVLGQILFIINLIAGFIRGKKVLNRTP